MKITKYPQSCFMIETCGQKILVDPGILDFNESFLEDWNEANFILVTHKHADHCNADILRNISCPIYSTQEVKDEYPLLNISIIEKGDMFNKDDVSVEVVNAVHGYIPLLKNRAEINENVGFIIKAENKKIYFTSDTICFKNTYKCDVICIPVSAHGLVMSGFEAGLFTTESEAKLMLPCHMDNPIYPVELPKLEQTLNKQNLKYKLLKTGDAIEV